MSMLGTYRFIAQHPLTKDHKAQAMVRWLRWQLASRVSRSSLTVPFVNQTRLLVRSGMTGATGNIYCGLHEFEDMGFLMHFLRPDDFFVDVGANIGAYSILAAASGAKVLSFEPVPSSFAALLDNIHLNRMGSRIDARPHAIGGSPGVLRMTADTDTTNRALSAGEHYTGETVEVDLVTLDQALKDMPVPALIKIDVEGFEMEVLKGAGSLLARPEVEALIIEVNGSGCRYGVTDTVLHAHLQSLGFRPYRYDPRSRVLVNGESAMHAAQGNALYLRHANVAQQRVSAAPSFNVLEQAL